jgi:hypothetical protein
VPTRLGLHVDSRRDTFAFEGSSDNKKKRARDRDVSGPLESSPDAMAEADQR